MQLQTANLPVWPVSGGPEGEVLSAGHGRHAQSGIDPIIVIGGGFSGTMAAIQLRRRLPAAQDVYLLERHGAFARGVAFADTRAPHLLNVRAANMSAFADDPGHFERWLEIHALRWPGELISTPAGGIATRRLYGNYLQATLHSEIAASGGRVRLLSEEVLELEPLETGWRLHCRGAKSLMARGVVLATGILPASKASDGVEFHNPWAPEALAGLRPDAPVLIVGTGLTMVDLALAMQAQGFTGPIIALSRRGLVPQAHQPVREPWPLPELPQAARASVLALLRSLRGQVRAAAARNIGWHAVFDGLRPLVSELWRGLPKAEQARFLRHARPYWDRHRHRMAPPAAGHFADLCARGGLSVWRGRVRAVWRSAGLARVAVERCGGGKLDMLEVQRVIYATGLDGIGDAQGLVPALLASGQARLDTHGLGLEVTNGFALVGAAGAPMANLWALGPLVRGMFWESVAVPDIRLQADRLSREIIAAMAVAPRGSLLRM